MSLRVLLLQRALLLQQKQREEWVVLFLSQSLHALLENAPSMLQRSNCYWLSNHLLSLSQLDIGREACVFFGTAGDIPFVLSEVRAHVVDLLAASLNMLPQCLLP